MRLPAFLALSAVTVAAVVVAGVLVAEQPRPATTTGDGTLIFPGLAGAANQIGAIRIQKGDETTTIALSDRGWGIKERNDYPAALEKIKQLVVNLAQLRRIEAKTDRPDRYDRIGVEDAAPGAGSTEVTVTDAQGQPLAKLLIGEAATAGSTLNAHFVRVPGESRAWLAEGAIDVEPAVTNWVDQTIVDFPGDRMAEVKITRPDGKTLTAVKADAAAPHFALRELPHNHRLKREDAVDTLAITLTQLQLQDLEPADQIAFPADKTSRIRFRTFDGLIIDADLVDHDGKDWIRLSPSTLTGASAETAATAASLAERTRGYAFNVYFWKVAPLKRSLDELSEPGSGS